MPKGVVVITGPTATGKTKLGIELAKSFGGEVISADSMQLYKYMDIGTATPDAQEMEGVPHHMLSVIEPWEAYSVSRYVEEGQLILNISKGFDEETKERLSQVISAEIPGQPSVSTFSRSAASPKE